MNQPPQDSGNGRKIALAIGLLLAAAGVTWFTSRDADEKAFTSIAYPCLPMDVTTTDPAQFVMVTGYHAPPDEHTMPDGTVVYAVFSHPDPKVVPKVDGKTLYFPARFIDDNDVVTPRLPPNNQPLNRQFRYTLVRYMAGETMQELKSAITGSGSPPPTEAAP